MKCAVIPSLVFRSILIFIYNLNYDMSEIMRMPTLVPGQPVS